MIIFNRIVYYITLFSLFITGSLGINLKSQHTNISVPDGYELVWSDEFDGDSLDTNEWRVENGARRGGYWDESQVFVSGGNLHIRTQYKEGGTFGDGYYTGAVQSMKEWTRGYFEMKCIHLDAKGAWSAFWLMCDGVANEKDDGTTGTEIDIVESPYSGSLLNRERVQNAICYNGYDFNYVRNTASLPVVTRNKSNSIYTTYHTYSCLWTETEYIFYIDGKETGRISKKETSNVPEYMILSGEVGGANGVTKSDWAFVGRLNDKKVCTDYIIDYVRVYQVK